jgi:hypothetical protein
MSRAIHFKPQTTGHRTAVRKTARVKRQPKLELVPPAAKEAQLIERSVEVFDRDGHLLETYTIVLEGVDCHDAEFEEVALIFAEQSGRVAAAELVHLRAICVK